MLGITHVSGRCADDSCDVGRRVIFGHVQDDGVALCEFSSDDASDFGFTHTGMVPRTRMTKAVWVYEDPKNDDIVCLERDRLRRPVL